MRITLICILLLFAGCEVEDTQPYCWECNMTIYNKNITDTFCDWMITDIEDYKQRMYSFYQGGLTNIDCHIIDSI